MLRVTFEVGMPTNYPDPDPDEELHSTCIAIW